MRYLQEGMKIRRKPNAVSRKWWTRGKEYEVYKADDGSFHEFFILDDDGDIVGFNFVNGDFEGSNDIMGNFLVVGDLYEESQEAPSGINLKNTRKAIRQIENELTEVESLIGYGYHENRETLERNYLKRDLLNAQLNCMNAILKDLEEFK